MIGLLAVVATIVAGILSLVTGGRVRLQPAKLQPGRTFHKASDHPIPKGFQIYDAFVPVKGVTYRQDAVRAFLSAPAPSLVFELEPSNHHDGNAVKVMGCSRGVPRWHLGYVASDLAAHLAATGLSARVLPRLTKTFVTEDGTAGVAFALLGPKTEIARFEAGWAGSSVET